MRMLRVQVTVRTVMLGVALSAVVISLAVRREAVRRAAHHRILADQHTESMQTALRLMFDLEAALLKPDYGRSELDVRAMRQYREEVTYYAALMAKYEGAAHHPLSPVAPDPRPPMPVSQAEVMRLSSRKIDLSEAMRLTNGSPSDGWLTLLGGLRGLRHLDLSKCGVTDAGLSHLGRSRASAG